MDLAPKRFDVYLVPLDPATGAEMKKTRPCLIISPDEMNDLVRTVIITPLTSSRTSFDFRARCEFQGVRGEVALDHIRTVDKRRLRKFLGRLNPADQVRVRELLDEIFGDQ
jgi:mRNA interferase MazF